jgi:hypothetical protein
MHFFQAHSLAILCFFHVLKDELKVTALVWCPDNDNVTHKYLAKKRRLARDETSFLSVVQLRATTLTWWPDDGNVIPLDTHDHDRSMLKLMQLQEPFSERMAKTLVVI